MTAFALTIYLQLIRRKKANCATRYKPSYTLQYDEQNKHGHDNQGFAVQYGKSEESEAAHEEMEQEKQEKA